MLQRVGLAVGLFAISGGIVVAVLARSALPNSVAQTKQAAALKVGDITTFAGAVGEGPAKTIGQIPYGIAVRGKLLYVLDNRKRVVRAIDVETGEERVVAGNGTQGFSGDGGPATSAKLDCLAGGVALDSAGNLYIGDFYNNRLRKVDPTGTISSVVSDLFLPTGVTVDASDKVYVADRNNNRVVKVTPSGVETTVAGGQQCAVSTLPCGDGGQATSAALFHPNGVAVANDGSIYIADTLDAKVRKVSPAGTITTVAGNGNPNGDSGDGGPAILATISYPTGVTLDSVGNLYITDSEANKIRKVDMSGIISTVVGTGTYDPTCSCFPHGFSGDDGPATAAQVYGPFMTAFDADGNLYVSDTGNYRVRKVDIGGIITTIAGNGSFSYSGDGGPASLAQLDFPEGVHTAPDGSVYIADTGNNRIRKVDPSGVISTLAGDGTAGFKGDGGPATAAQLFSPITVAVSAAGVYIADFSNHRIRLADNSGKITTIAGNGVVDSMGQQRVQRRWGPRDVCANQWPAWGSRRR